MDLPTARNSDGVALSEEQLGNMDRLLARAVMEMIPDPDLGPCAWRWTHRDGWPAPGVGAAERRHKERVAAHWTGSHYAPKYGDGAFRVISMWEPHLHAWQADLALDTFLARYPVNTFEVAIEVDGGVGVHVDGATGDTSVHVCRITQKRTSAFMERYQEEFLCRPRLIKLGAGRGTLAECITIALHETLCNADQIVMARIDGGPFPEEAR